MIETVLIVDDNPLDIERLKSFFVDAELANPIQIAANGGEALAYLGGIGRFSDRQIYPMPSLLFIDMIMPTKSGLDVLRAIQSRAPRLGIVAMTGIGSIQEVKEAYKLGAHSFLVKPLARRDFITLIYMHNNIRIHHGEGFKQFRFIG